MDIEKIKTFLLAIEEKSFSKAAEKLSYTPSALSHIADSIEAELGIKLLNRSFSGVELNANGLFLLDQLTDIVAAEKNLFAAADQLKEQNEQLRIGAYSSIAQYLLPEIIKKFKESFPSIKVSFKVGNDLNTWLFDDNVDVIFTDKVPEKARGVKIMDDPFMAIAPTGTFPAQKAVHKEQLYDYPCIMYNENIIKRYFECEKFKEIITLDSVDESSILTMVQQKLGIAVLPSLMLQHKNRQIRTLKLTPKLSRTIYFAYKKDVAQKKCVASFIGFIKKEFTL